jgi:hypothetical protein
MIKSIPDFKAVLSRCQISVRHSLSLGTALVAILLSMPALATQLADGRMVFDHAPRLVRTASTLHALYTPTIYQFTLTIPENAGASLKAVTITQTTKLELAKFNMARTTAFLGDSFAGGLAVPLASIGGAMPADSSAVTITFDQPIAPGKTVTISLEGKPNLLVKGAHLFGITAYPEGENSPGVFLGYGRVQVY